MVENGKLERNSVRRLRDVADGAIGEIHQTIRTLFGTGDVVEIRAFKDRTTVSGYFDDFEELTKQAAKLDGQDFAVYVTLNPVKGALLARAHNRIKHYPKATTSDADVLCRRWLPLDFDPARPSGVSATDQEKKAARLRALEVRDYLREQGWLEPVVGDSGNGYHLLYCIDLPNDCESLDLVSGVLEALAFKFSNDTVNLDASVHNAARIWKLYGTTARKGDDAGGRPHRRSRLLKVPEGAAAWT